MASYHLLILLFGVSAYAMPKMLNPVKDELNTAAASSLLMPGPVLFPGNDNEESINEFCQLCELVVSDVDSMMKHHLTEQKMEDELNKRCSKVGLKSRTCKAFVNQYIHIIMKQLASGMPPPMVCKTLGFCLGSKMQAISAVNQVNAVGESPRCIICEMIVRELRLFLSEGATQEKMVQALKRLCRLFPRSKRGQCESYVQENAPVIIRMLIDKVKPVVICTKLHLCASSNIMPAVSADNPVNAVGESRQCILCEKVVRKLKSALSKGSTQKQIVQALKQLCRLYPRSKRGQCVSYVQEHAPAIIKMLIDKVDPVVICTKLRLCASSNIMPENMVENVGNYTPCDICMSVLNVAKQLVEDNETEADVEKALKLICWYMLPVRTECDDFIDNTVPLVFNELKKLDPKTICEQLKLCPSGFLPDDVRCYMKERNICQERELAKKCRTDAYCKVIEWQE